MTAFQNFPISASNALDVTFNLDPTDGINLSGATVYWQVFNQFSGVIDDEQISGPVIAKDSNTGGITILDSPADQFIVHLVPADTVGLLANYIHEALIIDADGNPATVVKGVMTVTYSGIML